ncbi:hypothetical protein [Flavobacterium filum]|uniref:hypothetical protein n=1 Tax=Flavobacterium filum TaxID=370974 RepID=UPI0003FFBF32|nr:hypothetical protein [Flavobacterium filum]
MKFQYILILILAFFFFSKKKNTPIVEGGGLVLDGVTDDFGNTIAAVGNYNTPEQIADNTPKVSIPNVPNLVVVETTPPPKTSDFSTIPPSTSNPKQLISLDINPFEIVIEKLVNHYQ